MKDTRNLLTAYEINYANVPKFVQNYLDGKCELTRKVAIYLEDFLMLPSGTIEIYEREYKKWINEKI